jgi:alcohol dehydrogenase (cytochrome c)
MQALGLLFALLAAAPQAGERHYQTLCARCHGGDGNGGEMGPEIRTRISVRTDNELQAIVREGLPGMPGFRLEGEEMRGLIAFLRTLPPPDVSVPVRATLAMAGDRSLEGVVLNRTSLDMQVLADDGRVHLLRKMGERYRAVTSDVDWPTYHGDLSGNRYTSLDQIDKSNVARLSPRFLFTVAGASRLQVTPIVADGILYVTNANECYALDAGNGRTIWHYRRPRTEGLSGDASAGINRGVAVSGDRVFMVTDHAHLLALHRFTGRLLWETEMADFRQNYGATSAPLAVEGLVISGS